MTELNNKNIHKNFFCLDNHPLVKHKMTLIRDKNTSPKEFREILEEITLIVASEALRNLKFTEKTIETPLATYKGISINDVTLIPVIRAGLAMMAPLQKLLPDSKVGFMGASRNHSTLETQQYYVNIPKIDSEGTALILDPMLATGNTIAHTLNYLKENNTKNIIVISIICVPNALDVIFKTFPNCLVYTAALDSTLNEKGYIVPGLGDAGDRIFNTFE